MIPKLLEPIIHTLSKPQQLPLYFNLTADNAQLRHFSTAVLRSAFQRQTTPPQQQVFQCHFNGISIPLTRTFQPSRDFRTLHLDHTSSAFSGLRNFDVQGKSVRFRLNCRGFCRNINFSEEGNVEGEIVDPNEVERVCKIVEEWVTDGCGSKFEGGKVKGEIVESKADPKEVERVCEIVKESFGLHQDMEEALDGYGIDLTHDLVVDVLQRFKHALFPAFRFFSWAGQNPGFRHDSRSYNSMMAILGKTRRFDTMVALLEEMGVQGLLTDKSFHIYIRAFAAAKQSEKALGIFELMKRYKFEVGVDIFNILLENLGRAKLGKEAQLLFEKLEGSFTPNLQSYAILINNWCIAKNLLEARKMWNEMIHKGFQPDIVAHNSMLEGLLRAKKRSGAIKLFEFMKANGPAPNVQSYKILIRDLRKQKKMNEAVEYFEEMNEAGCKPDVLIYTSLITGFGNQNKMDKVYGLLTEMKEKGYTPDKMMYNALVKLMANRQLLDNAMRIYKKMIQSGIQPTVDTYTMMLKLCFKAKNSDMALTVWEEMFHNGCCPDPFSYIVFIRGLVKQDKLVEACEYLEEMIEKGTTIPQLDYDRYFAGDFIGAGKPDILEKLAQRMKFSGKFELSNVFTRWARKSREINTSIIISCGVLFEFLLLGLLVLLLFLALALLLYLAWQLLFLAWKLQKLLIQLL